MPCRRSMRSAEGIGTDLGPQAKIAPSCGAPTLGAMKTSAIPGLSVRRSAHNHREQGVMLALLAAAALILAAVIGPDAAGGVAALPCALGLLLVFEARRELRLGRRYRVGAVSEERVGSRLWALEARGWLVAHDVAKAGDGNVDHLVHSPAVTFVVETKTSCPRERDIEQARRQAQWAVATYGPGREVIAVLCVQRSKDRPRLAAGVYVVGAPHLLDFMLDRG